MASHKSLLVWSQNPECHIVYNIYTCSHKCSEVWSKRTSAVKTLQKQKTKRVGTDGSGLRHYATLLGGKKLNPDEIRDLDCTRWALSMHSSPPLASSCHFLPSPVQAWPQEPHKHLHAHMTQNVSELQTFRQNVMMGGKPSSRRHLEDWVQQVWMSWFQQERIMMLFCSKQRFLHISL